MTLEIEDIVRQAEHEGVTLQVTEKGRVKAAGKGPVLERWTPVFRERKADLVAFLGDASRRPPTVGGLRAKNGEIPEDRQTSEVGGLRGGLRENDRLFGAAVLFVNADLRCWIVADGDDAAALRRSGIEPVDVILDRGEARALVAVDDPGILAEILAFKLELPGGRLRFDRG